MENTEDVIVLNNNHWVNFYNSFLPICVEKEELESKRRYDIHRYIFEPFEFNLKLIKEQPVDKVWSVIHLKMLKETRIVSDIYPNEETDELKLIGYLISTVKRNAHWQIRINVDFNKLHYPKQLNMFQNETG